MVRTFSRRQGTPAANAAAHLLRIGFVILVVAAPIASVGSRRGFLVLAPLGIGIVFLAAMVDGRAGRTFNGVGRFLASAAGVAAIALLAWAALSLGWTSARTLGGDRLVKIFATLLLAVFACVSLPNRMRASNLYLIPLGVLLAALLAIAAAVYGLLPFRAFDPDQPTLERAAAAISLQMFAGVAWLATKQRPVLATGLVMVVLTALGLAMASESLIALACGGLVTAAAFAWPGTTTRVLAIGMAGILLLAPLLAVTLQPIAAHLPFLDAADQHSLAIWSRVVREAPLMTIVGRGMESAAFDAFSTRLGLEAPHSMLFEIWYELGLFGALALGVFLAVGTIAVSRLPRRVAAFGLGTVACAFMHGALGSGTVQTWWMTTLCLAAVAFTGASNGQYRSVRPRAALAGRGSMAAPGIS